jgi:hypothetical protein
VRKSHKIIPPSPAAFNLDKQIDKKNLLKSMLNLPISFKVLKTYM